MPSMIRFEAFTQALNEKKHNLTSDTLKFMLTNNAPSLSWDTKSDVTGELSTGGGYTAGGLGMTGKVATSSGGVYSLVCDDPSWTASGSGFGPFRYCILYNDSATNDDLIGYLDFGFAVSVTSPNVFKIELPTSAFYFSS